MRRKDREITDFNEIVELIGRCPVIRLGMVDDTGRPYIVPLNYGLEVRGETLAFYFHGARKGRKIDILEKNPNVCFEMDCEMELHKAPVPCEWTAYYGSVMGEGTVAFLEENDEKRHALACLMKRYGFDGKMEFAPEHVKATAVFKLEVTSVTAKRNAPKPE